MQRLFSTCHKFPKKYIFPLQSIIQDLEDERERMRREIQRSQEEYHTFLQSGSGGGSAATAGGAASSLGSSSSSSVSSAHPAAGGIRPAQAAAAAASAVTSPGSTRPASFISVEDPSSGADPLSSVATTNSERNHESEDDGESDFNNRF